MEFVYYPFAGVNDFFKKADAITLFFDLIPNQIDDNRLLLTLSAYTFVYESPFPPLANRGIILNHLEKYQQLKIDYLSM